MRAKELECGKIINTHGIAGDVKLESWCDSPEVLAAVKRLIIQTADGKNIYKVKKASVFKSFVIAKLEGVNDIDAAASLVGRTVYAEREELPLGDGDHFIADLVGLPVKDVDDGRVYGELREVINRGASDIYVIKTPDGERMIPAVDEFVKRIDIDDAIYIKPIGGMFDDEV